MKEKVRTSRLFVILSCIAALTIESVKAESNCLWSTPTTPTTCKFCKRGWYGDNCDNKCINCDIGGCDRETGSCLQCKYGFHSENCSVTCPSNCRESYDGKVYCDRNTSHCLENCKANWWGDKCTEECNDNCVNKSCLFYGGSCSIGCSAGLTGAQCDQKCSVGCFGDLCYQWNGLCVSGCKDGYYGTACDVVCPKACQGGECDNSDGKCTNGCKTGYYGTQCDNICSPFCFDRNCSVNKTTGVEECPRGCVAGRTAASCDRVCPGNCIRCEQTTGECQLCNDGFWGKSCSSTCSSKCLNRSCDMKGNCKDCVQGTHGPTCDQTCPDGCSICSQAEGICTGTEHHDNVGIVAGSVTGAVILVFLVTMFVIWMVRRRASRRNNRGPMYYQHNAEMRSEQSGNGEDGDGEAYAKTLLDPAKAGIA